MEIAASIHNCSSRGMMLSCARPPCRGEYLEIKADGQNICARVVWSDGRRFGVRTREVVTLGLAASRDGRVQALRLPPVSEEARKPQMMADAAIAASRLMQWTALAVAGVALAIALALAVGNSLGTMSEKVNIALHQQGS
jgi:hypothetical protein